MTLYRVRPGHLAAVADLLGLNDHLTSLLLEPSQQCIENRPRIVLNPPNTTTDQPSSGTNSQPTLKQTSFNQKSMTASETSLNSLKRVRSPGLAPEWVRVQLYLSLLSRVGFKLKTRGGITPFLMHVHPER